MWAPTPSQPPPPPASSLSLRWSPCDRTGSAFPCQNNQQRLEISVLYFSCSQAVRGGSSSSTSQVWVEKYLHFTRAEITQHRQHQLISLSFQFSSSGSDLTKRQRCEVWGEGSERGVSDINNTSDLTLEFRAREIIRVERENVQINTQSWQRSPGLLRNQRLSSFCPFPRCDVTKLKQSIHVSVSSFGNR